MIASVLINPYRFVEIASELRPEDFHDPVYRTIFASMGHLQETRRPIDFVTVSDELRNDPSIAELGGTAFLAGLCSELVTSSNAPAYAVIIREKALQRKLLEVGQSMVALAKDDRLPALEAIEQAEQKLLALSRHSTDNKPQHIADIGQESYQRYAELHEATDKTALFGLRTGFNQLDLLLTGLPAGHLMIVAARPSMGKTSFALDIARHVAGTQGKQVAVFSLEMTKQELMDRVIAGLLGIETWKLKKGQLTASDFAELGKIFDGLKNHPLYIDDDPDTTISNLRSKARRQHLEHDLDLLIIDYLQLIEVTDRASGENRTQQVSHISRSLKNLARELGCPIIPLSQLSRSVEQRNPPIPILSDLRESGSIEQDADSVLMLYRQGAYNEDCDDPLGTDIYVRKNRNGPTGRIELHFDAARMSFKEVDRRSSPTP